MTIAERAAIPDLAQALGPLAARTAGREKATLVSVTVPVAAVDPIALYAAARPLGASLWMQPDEGRALVGIGEAWAARQSHGARFAVISVAFLVIALLASFFLGLIKPQPLTRVSRRLVFKRKYTLFYILNILFGARKQIFLTFAPWVLIKVFHANIETFAILGFIGTVLSLFFRPLLGKAIDAWGEKRIIILESILLIIISLLYGFSANWFPTEVAVLIIMAYKERIRVTTWIDSNGQYHGAYYGRKNLKYREHANFRPVLTFEQSHANTPPLPDGMR